MEAAPLAELFGISWLWWWQIPLLVVVLVVFLIGGWLLLWVGGRFVVKAPKATLGRAFVTNLLAALAGLLGMAAASATLTTVSRPAGPLLGWVAFLFAYWLVVKGMFGVSFGKAIMAWLPVIPVGLVSIALLVGLMMPTLGRARQIAQIGMCAASLDGVGKAVQFHAAEHGGPPEDVQVLIDVGSLQPGHLRCPGAKPGRPSDFFVFFSVETPSTPEVLVACDLKRNHFDGSRNVLTYGGTVRKLSAGQFQAELAKPINVDFAAALREAEASLPVPALIRQR